MNFSIEKNENYTLIKTTLTELDDSFAHAISEQVAHVLNSSLNRYLILHFDSINACTASAVRILIESGKQLIENDGLLIIINPTDAFRKMFDIADIIVVPTDAEAIDYVFMDQIEKEFLNGDE